MNTTDVYDHFRINRGLRQHMLRVGAVVEMVRQADLDTFSDPKVLQAALLHDVGNIMKVKFDFDPEMFEPEGVVYYEQVQKEVGERYGRTDYEATVAMLHELQVDEAIIDLILKAELGQTTQILESGSPALRLLFYADMRVGPHGVVSMSERCDDITNRYVPHRFTPEAMAMYREALEAIEQQLFADLSLNPDDITEESTAEIQQQLLTYELI